VLSSELTRTAAERQALQASVRAAGKLAHPNIVTAYDANERQDRFYLVLEFVDGPNLDALVRQRGPLSAAEACEFVRQTAAGLQHAHEKGMVHRDIKPTNLLVARPTPVAPLTVKIADFGLPKAPSAAHAGAFAAPEVRNTRTGPRPGTRTAPAPAPIDARADLYSLGCVFYFLLTGRAPDAVPVPLNQVRPDVAPEVAGIVHRLLAPYPAVRFGSAAELLVHLDAVCVPVAIPMDEVIYDPPADPVAPGHDSGYLTGRSAQPGSGSFAPPPQTPSPWEHLTDEAAEETRPLELDDTPEPVPHKPKAPGHGEPVPLWMTATLLVGIVLLCLVGIGIAVKLLVK
jgi:serine/threonine-protein kinase